MPSSMWLIDLALWAMITWIPYKPQMGRPSESTRLPPISIEEKVAARHLEGDWPDIRLASSDSAAYRPFQGLRFMVTVNEEGHVVEVELEKAEDGDPHPAGFDEGRRLVRSLKFTPFDSAGHNVPARFSLYVPVFPPERIPPEHLIFPALSDRGSLVMTVEKTGCYGTCPTYRIEVHGDGTVNYDGQCFVAVRGHRTSRISEEAVASLFELFQRADYFSLDAGYWSPVTDMPTYTTSISFDGHSKSVTDYYGLEMGMPDAVKTIERSMDRLTNSVQWLTRNGRWKPSKRRRCG